MTGPLSIIIAAGGSSRRYGEADKLIEELDGLPVFLHSLRAFAPLAAPDALIVVVREEARETYRRLQQRFLPEISPCFVSGGSSRSASVRNGLAALPGNEGIVAVHDAARPLASAQLLRKVADQAAITGGAIAAVKVVDSVKKVQFPRITEAVPREALYLAQTPQVFRLSLLRQAYELLGENEVTDDAEVMRRAGFPVDVVDSGEPNEKLTSREDLLFLRTLIRMKKGA